MALTIYSRFPVSSRVEPVLCLLCKEFASLPQVGVISGHHAMLGPALPQGALPQVVDAVLSRRHLRGLQVRHVSVSGYAFRAAA